jgi:hypothetical protein
LVRLCGVQRVDHLQGRYPEVIGELAGFGYLSSLLG